MNVGMIGLGKLGLPVSLCLAQKHTVYGHDVNPDLMKYREYEHAEKGPDGGNDFQVYFKSAYRSRLRFVGLEESVHKSDIIFIAVQTPHDPLLDGSRLLTSGFKDFNYTFLIQAVDQIRDQVRPDQTVAIISTVLPGTIRRNILPILGDRCKIFYNPFFIAMGTVMYDFMHPEFVLIGSQYPYPSDLYNFYSPFYGGRVPILPMSFESAELTKMAYNSYITQKINFANLLGEMAHKIPGCDALDVTTALSLAYNRLISTKYLSPGMGDGGACHPRDCFAMAWLAEEIGMSSDLWSFLSISREEHARWLADLVTEESAKRSLPIIILGKSFKAESKILAGSPALLLADILTKRRIEFYHYDPHVDNEPCPLKCPGLFFIATKHRCFTEWFFLKGSVVIDPWRVIPDQDGVEVIRIGVGK